MKGVILCSHAKSFARQVKYPKITKVYQFKELKDLPPSVVIIDYRYFRRRSSLKLDGYADKLFILYAPADQEDAAKKLLSKYPLFDYFTEETPRKQVKLKLKKSRHILVTLKENAALKSDLKTLKRVDPELGCYTWRFFSEVIPDLIQKSRKRRAPLFFVIVDIDYFRQVNESYGYEFADNIIKDLVKLLQKIVPADTPVIRCRDDAFIIVLSGQREPSVYKLAEKIRAKVKRNAFSYRTLKTHITLSIGVVSVSQHGIANYRDVMVALDTALAFSKRAGGNRVTIYSQRLKKDAVSTESKSDVKSLTRNIARLNKEINQVLLDMTFGFAKAIEARDMPTARHVEDVSWLARGIAEELKLPPHQVEDVYHAAILHDLGKIGINSEILLKKGKLNKKDWEVIKTHPWIAAEILREIHILRGALPAILYHHERWDGKGYPLGLKGEEIPLPARIVSIADVYEALISDRPYRKAFTKKKAVEIIKSESGTHFDPAIVEVFLRVVNKRKKY